MKTFFLTHNGHGFTPDGTIPVGCVPCTREQIDAGCILVNGEITYPCDSDILKSRVTEKKKAIESAAQDEICSGFVSDALGSPHIYPSTPIDQQNLTANVMSSVFPGVGNDWVTDHMCADVDSLQWNYRPHTAIQIQSVGVSCKSHILKCLKKLNDLRANLDACQSSSEVENIQW